MLSLQSPGIIANPQAQATPKGSPLQESATEDFEVVSPEGLRPCDAPSAELLT